MASPSWSSASTISVVNYVPDKDLSWFLEPDGLGAGQYVCQSGVEHQTKTFPERTLQEARGAHFSSEPMPELAHSAPLLTMER